MKVEKFWVRGYRSLRDVTLDGLCDFNIFYGPNGSGKSNILDALHTFFGLMPLAVDTAYGPEEERLSFREGGRLAQAWVRDDDFFAREPALPIILGALITDPTSGFEGALVKARPVQRVEVEIQVSRSRSNQFNLQVKRLFVNGRPPGLPFPDSDVRSLVRGLVPQAFTHVGVVRTLTVRTSLDGQIAEGRVAGTIPDGELVQRLFEAKNSADRSLRDRFDQVREFMAKALHRGEFDVFMRSNKELELREKLPPPNPEDADIPVDNAGHGIVQMYAIIATIMLAAGSLVAIEEPEAHLHAPTMGKELRTILQQLNAEGRVQQFFIATHSNLFDLDLTGYWDVALEDGETRVQRKPLDEIDRLHLFEPGPAKHQLQEMLRLYGNDVVFRAGDGRPVTAEEMLLALQNDEGIAQAFLETLHAAAMQVTGLRAKRALESDGKAK